MLIMISLNENFCKGEAQNLQHEMEKEAKHEKHALAEFSYR